MLEVSLLKREFIFGVQYGVLSFSAFLLKRVCVVGENFYLKNDDRQLYQAGITKKLRQHQHQYYIISIFNSITCFTKLNYEDGVGYEQRRSSYKINSENSDNENTPRRQMISFLDAEVSISINTRKN